MCVSGWVPVGTYLPLALQSSPPQVACEGRQLPTQLQQLHTHQTHQKSEQDRADRISITYRPNVHDDICRIWFVCTDSALTSSSTMISKASVASVCVWLTASVSPWILS